MRLTPAERLAPVKPCSVAVVSDGDRLSAAGSSRHMINALLPGEADVHHLSFRTLDEARAHYDLVIVGAGDSLFQPLIGDELHRSARRAARPRSACSARNTASSCRAPASSGWSAGSITGSRAIRTTC